MVGIENPRATTNKAAIDGGLEANTVAILDSSGLKNSRDLHDDKLSFLEAVRAASLVSDSLTAPSWKMFDAIFQILRGSDSLELAMASYQLLTDLDKRYPRVYLKSPDDLASKSESTSSGARELVVAKEAWSPFSVCPETAEGVGTSRNSLHADSLATDMETKELISIGHEEKGLYYLAESLLAVAFSSSCAFDVYCCLGHSCLTILEEDNSFSWSCVEFRV